MSSGVANTIACSSQQRQRSWCETPFEQDEVCNAIAVCELLATKEKSFSRMQTLLQSLSTPNSLWLPILEYNPGSHLVVETQDSVICGIGMSNIIWDLVVSKKKEFKYGGMVNGMLFERATKRVGILRIYDEYARAKGKRMILCGHSIAGAIAHICALVLLYHECLPKELKRFLKSWDAKNQESLLATEENTDDTTGAAFEAELKDWISKNNVTIPPCNNVYSIGFGASFFADCHISKLMSQVGFNRNIVTLVNEKDCIPGALNISQSAAIMTKTTERLLTIAKSTKVLLSLVVPTSSNTRNLLPLIMKSTYVSLLTSVMDKALRKVREERLFETNRILISFAPCGSYLKLNELDRAYLLTCDAAEIADNILNTVTEASTLTGSNLLDHSLSAYASAVTSRVVVNKITAEMNHYERLFLDQKTATRRDIRNAYKKLALKWHPDKWSSRSASERSDAESAFKLLTESYEILSDPVTKKQYDQVLNQDSGGTQKFTDEILRRGTVAGMTVDEAIAKFSDFVEQSSYAASKVGFSFNSTTSSSVVSQATSRVTSSSSRFQAGNHNNLFAPGKMKVLREADAASTERVAAYIDADELLPTDVSATATSSSIRSTSAVVGGAVAVGAGVAMVVAAWSSYSEASRKKRQAEAVSKMNPSFLHRLMIDNGNSSTTTDDDLSNNCEEFFDCVQELEVAMHEQELEDVFYDCVEDILFVGVKVCTPFGVGEVLAVGEFSSKVRISKTLIAYVSNKYLKRGGAVANAIALTQSVESRQRKVVNTVLQKYSLQKQRDSHHHWGVLRTGAGGAVDSGFKAAGGMALAKGLGRIAPAAAPLAIASILVDIGKEYMDFRQEQRGREAGAMKSEASERILMQDFRNNVGMHVVSGGAAAAGAGISAYTLSYFATMLSGPIGLAAATGVAVVGGVLGYVTGSSIYNRTASAYFSDYYQARDEIKRLELGAKILFQEFDTSDSGYISRNDCESLVLRLQSACGKKSVPDDSVSDVLSFLRNETFQDKPVSWNEFWEWVSKQALVKLNSSLKGVKEEECDTSSTMYPSVFTALGFKQQSTSVTTSRRTITEGRGDNAFLSKCQTMFSTYATDGNNISRKDCEELVVKVEALEGSCVKNSKDVLTYLRDETFANKKISWSEFEAWLKSQENNIFSTSSGVDTSEWERAKLAELSDILTEEDEHRIRVMLREGSEDERRQALRTIDTLSEALGATEDQEITSDEQNHHLDFNEEQLDALCSLLSRKGLMSLLRDYGIQAHPSLLSHDELHGLVLANSEHIILQTTTELLSSDKKKLLLLKSSTDKSPTDKSSTD